MEWSASGDESQVLRDCPIPDDLYQYAKARKGGGVKLDSLLSAYPGDGT